jgi:5-methylthioadenosine/S-adenosylhomocysteine deaminase
MASLKLTSATLVTMNDALDVIEGDLSIRDGRIAAVGAVDPAWRHDRTIDVAGAIVLPGFIQTHVHLCQTLFRGRADDLPLLAWLRERVWPLEAAHDPRSLAAAARLAAAQLLRGGTTPAVTIE